MISLTSFASTGNSFLWESIFVLFDTAWVLVTWFQGRYGVADSVTVVIIIYVFSTFHIHSVYFSSTLFLGFIYVMSTLCQPFIYVSSTFHLCFVYVLSTFHLVLSLLRFEYKREMAKNVMVPKYLLKVSLDKYLMIVRKGIYSLAV
jgi:uncharacterized membrane protein YgaE (UPF0421/DUF939 family)